MARLSVVISAFNSEDKIKDCLESVKWADEIIFVDNSSTDKTLDITKKYTSKIFIKTNNKMLNINKNFGFSKATSDWILSLDSDERVTPSLRDEIKNKISNIKNDDVNGYWIPRKNIIFGKWMQHTGWYPDHQLRLFRNGRGRFKEKHVHEMIEVEGETAYLNNNIVHYNYDTIIQFLSKMANIYAPNEAEQMVAKGYVFSWRDAIRFPLGEFLSRFFAREGYRDGFHGLMLSILMAFYHFIVFANVWEMQKFNDPTDDKLLDEVGSELDKSHKQIRFWSSKERIKQIKNPFKKALSILIDKFRW
ncbi:MAG: glycosyltransferase family 2 protein [Candidatus Levybacteria bacterium]|nr:glycosyltransferase family 2 protein [Candidatus Levybacteria bacterium]